MILDIKPIKNDAALDCVENIIAAVAAWWGRSTIMMFKHSWNFALKLKSADAPTLGERMGWTQDYDNYIYKKFVYLAQYHGIKINYHDINDTETLALIQRELSFGRPTIIAMDGFVCPWAVEYSRIHMAHIFLVKGIDEHNLVCIDMEEPVKDNIILSMEEYRKGFSPYCLTFEKIGEEALQDANWRELVETTVSNLREPAGIGAFDQLKILAAELIKADFKEELEGYEYYPLAPIFEEFVNMGQSRQRFARVLQFFGKQENLTALLSSAEELNQIGFRWNAIKGMLLKGHISGDIAKFLQIAAAKILELTAEEEDLAGRLLQFSKTGTDTYAAASVPAPVNKKGANNDEVLLVDLSGYFNNQGFGESLTKETRADFTGKKEYFLAEGLSDAKVWQFDGIKFNFPKIAIGINDNISCTGAIIPITPGNFTGLAIIGCAEQGNYSDRMEFQYDGGESEQILLEFPDWLAPENHPPFVYSGTTIWSGKSAVRTKLYTHYLPYEGHIYIKTYSLSKNNNLLGIKLPDCPNIHIFAITLGNW